MLSAEDFRDLALNLLESEEVETWGHPTFRVRDKMFAAMDSDGHRATVKATPQEQEALIAAAPEVYAVADYVGRYGWVSVDLRAADPEEIAELVREAWRRTAPKRLVNMHDAAGSRSAQ
ncbi:MmcQ/YjbR family DNA-binding protein [Allokutzneria sp. A3M-2-11 16]|uniref:MmcQ/YjbR family DNA-binding protein n=1 Tax=Allokutzneria sp. A3M-2-11 16 TaxID=2962043 RepID=UPI0020B71162|nr:MmcQ/YjbR family DNA-binding protein [Allokutzneria sp. A3M-2-11 16]MCP3801811.1 MmcQ/YjbR family DNA-binding protein [Allokutzneria sp. A3M-2-11 16]